jgi:riboflavin synthase
MFTGIVEEIGIVKNISKREGNLLLSIHCSFVNELKIDDSISHNGVCLTVTDIKNDFYSLTIITETLNKSNLGNLNIGDAVNLERSMLPTSRLDGHIVQGHVDQTARCTEIKELNGSWIFTFGYDESSGNMTVEKGSICVNGVSLTVINSKPGIFSVAIIPYTFFNTNFNTLKKGSSVNIEFDIIGKYVQQYLKNQKLITDQIN